MDAWPNSHILWIGELVPNRKKRPGRGAKENHRPQDASDAAEMQQRTKHEDEDRAVNNHSGAPQGASPGSLSHSNVIDALNANRHRYESVCRGETGSPSPEKPSDEQERQHREPKGACAPKDLSPPAPAFTWCTHAGRVERQSASSGVNASLDQP